MIKLKFSYNQNKCYKIISFIFVVQSCKVHRVLKKYITGQYRRAMPHVKMTRVHWA